MKYEFKNVPIAELVNWIDRELIDLSPSYQRNFIWSPKDQSELIDTILKGFPLPNFFVYLRPDGKYEMVDGQQRATTIYSFFKGKVASTSAFGKVKYSSVKEKLQEYLLPFIFISELGSGESLKDFYVLINKKGKHLNLPEVNKSEYHDTNFLKLASQLLSYQNLIDLDLFTATTSKRMNDRAFIEELLGFLKMGIREKKKSVEVLFENDISDEEFRELKDEFETTIDRIHVLNRHHPIKKTRYKQKNDFYTLFSFIKTNLDSSEELALYQYKVLLVLDGKDKAGRQFIRPTNDDCEPLKKYATNCVSQSNSKKAREERLQFFVSVLKNENIETNHVFREVLKYLGSLYGFETIQLTDVHGFKLLDVSKLKEYV